MRVAVIWGTRPEVIKLAPVVRALENTPLDVDCINTGQHWDLSMEAEDAMKVRSKHYIRHHITHRLFADKLAAYGGFLEQLLEESKQHLASAPYAAIICQGDTVTTLAAALAGFHQKIPVVHVEAGLRSGNMTAPWPEEMHRRMITQLANLHCCPTGSAARAVTLEGNAKVDQILVTGNTIVDAVQWCARTAEAGQGFGLEGKEFVLVTLHRRENEGWINEFMRGLVLFASHYPQVNILFPQHPNPELVGKIQRGMELAEMYSLAYSGNIHMPGPMNYFEFLSAMNLCKFVVSDSGGVSEEAAILHKHQLITRLTTERSDLVRWGYADQIVAEDGDGIFTRMQKLLHKKGPPKGVIAHPFGKPGAGIRVANAICKMLRVSHEVH